MHFKKALEFAGNSKWLRESTDSWRVRAAAAEEEGEQKRAVVWLVRFACRSHFRPPLRTLS